MSKTKDRLFRRVAALTGREKKLFRDAWNASPARLRGRLRRRWGLVLEGRAVLVADAERERLIASETREKVSLKEFDAWVRRVEALPVTGVEAAS